uniref:Uncharacterized protein n=1 Tax=Meloidogyne incognita TaxID=6306 RepID=A0A914MP32_MELIC
MRHGSSLLHCPHFMRQRLPHNLKCDRFPFLDPRLRHHQHLKQNEHRLGGTTRGGGGGYLGKQKKVGNYLIFLDTQTVFKWTFE